MKTGTIVFFSAIVINGFVAHQVQNETAINSAIPFIALSFVEYIIWYLFIKEFRVINDRMYFYRSSAMGSYPNFFGQTEGNRWTSSFIVKNALKKGNLFLDQFRFDLSVKKRFKFFSYTKMYSDFDCYITPYDLTQGGGIVFGGMGSGKTEFYHSIISQNVFERILAYTNKGDFVQKHYRQHKDIILNPYDARSHMWNPFEEAETSPFVIGVFMTNLFNAIAGDQKDFFSAGSQDRYMQLFNHIQFNNPLLSAKEKFDLFIKSLKEYFEAPQTQSRTSEADIVSTMKLSFEFLDYMNFCIQNGSPTFTINNYLKHKKCRLFLLAREDQKSKLTPFFSAFIAAFTSVMLSQEDQKESFTLFALDEYLTFARNMDDDTLEGLHTGIRSKGGALLPGVQFFPENHSANGLTQRILNSARYWFLFQGIDEYTLDKINNTIGIVRYKKEQFKDKHSDRFDSKDYATEESSLLNKSMFQSLAQKFEHITFLPGKKLLYKGYTPKLDLKNKNEPFIQSDNIAKFYQRKS